MKKSIAEVVPLESFESCEENFVIECSKDGEIVEKLILSYQKHGILYADVYLDEYPYPFPVGVGKYFALKFTDIADGI